MGATQRQTSGKGKLILLSNLPSNLAAYKEVLYSRSNCFHSTRPICRKAHNHTHHLKHVSNSRERTKHHPVLSCQYGSLIIHLKQIFMVQWSLAPKITDSPTHTTRSLTFLGPHLCQTFVAVLPLWHFVHRRNQLLWKKRSPASLPPCEFCSP